MKSVTFIVPTNLNNPLLESTFLTYPIFKVGFWNGIQYVIQKRKEMLPIFTTYLTIYPDKLIMKRNYKGYKRIWLSKRQAKRRKRIQNLPEFWEKLKLQVGK
jgi:hypothetical protein